MFTLILIAIVILIPAIAFANVCFGGDSLALGFGRASHAETHAVGEPSCPNRKWRGIARLIPRRHYTEFYVSPGSNDPPGQCLEQIRARIHADRIHWIIPVVPGARQDRLELRAVLRRVRDDRTHSVLT